MKLIENGFVVGDKFPRHEDCFLLEVFCEGSAAIASSWKRMQRRLCAADRSYVAARIRRDRPML
jgi:hypothetical protein